MKRIISLVIALTFCLLAFASCAPKTPDVNYLDDAVAYVDTLYKKASASTGADYTVVNKYSAGDIFYDITWTVTVKNAADNGKVVVEKGTGKDTIKITVDKPEADIPYTLTGTITDDKGNTKTVSYERFVPMFAVTTYEEWIAGCASGKEMIIRAYIIGVVSNSSTGSVGSMYLQDADGHGYYAYAPALNMEYKGTTVAEKDDELRSEYPVGAEVLVYGTGTIYNGQYEFNKGCTVVKTGNTKDSFVPNDGTKDWAAATSAKDTSLIKYQNALVTLKDCVLAKIDGSYYYFTVGESTVQFNIYDNAYFLTEEERNAYKDNWVVGSVADISGIVSCYSNLYQVYPVSKDAVVFKGVKELTDAEAVEFEAGNLSIGTAVTESTSITLPAVGATYDKVAITWTSDNACAVVENGKLVVTLPEVETVVKVTATLTAGTETKTVEFEITVDAAPSAVYVPSIQTEFVANKAYKLVLFQNALGKVLYFNGAASGDRYLATTDKADKAVDVFVEIVEGGYKLYFMNDGTKTYLEIGMNASNKTAVLLKTESDLVYTFNADAKTFVATVDGKDYYMGTYNKYDTVSVSETKYITGDNASKVDDSQFPSRLCTLEEAITAVTPTSTPAADKAYKLVLFQNALGQTLYFDGGVSGNRYLTTTDKLDKAVDVFVEVVEGGFKLYFMNDGTKTYLEIGMNSDNKTAVLLKTESDVVYTFNADAKTLIATVDGKEYYMGTYNKYNTVSVSETKYITGDNAAKVDDSQFPARLCEITVVPAEKKIVTDLEENVAYKLVLFQKNLGKDLFFDGKTSGDRYLTTSTSFSKGVDVFVEKVEGGYKVFFMDGETKTYLEIGMNASNKTAVLLKTESDVVYTMNEDAKTLVTNVGGKDYYMGSYNSFDTVSVSETKYITGDNAVKVDDSQFPARLVVIVPAK